MPPKTEASATIYLAGSINNWNPADSLYRFKNTAANKFELVLNLPSGINEYKITRGSWDKSEVKLNGSPASNRMLFVAKDTIVELSVEQWQDNFKQAEKKHTASKNVSVLDSAFYIPQLDKNRRIWIYLPPDYNTSIKKYPVIYMQDGQNLFDQFTSGYGEWGVDEIMDSLSRSGSKMSIIVGIDHGGDARLTEYNPYSNTRFGKGRGNDYVDFLAKTLKPYIDKNFRTKESAKNTSVGGSSMGGLISMYAIAKYPKVFGKAAVFSPSFWLTPEIYEFVKEENLKKNKIYFLAGELESNEMVPDMIKMRELLISEGVKEKNLKIKTSPDGKHSEWFWHKEFPDFYNWITGK
ncbi:MAG: alpha/beta hydrolase-fold protein [Daejeonella sp.]